MAQFQVVSMAEHVTKAFEFPQNIFVIRGQKGGPDFRNFKMQTFQQSLMIIPFFLKMIFESPAQTPQGFFQNILKTV